MKKFTFAFLVGSLCLMNMASAQSRKPATSVNPLDVLKAKADQMASDLDAQTVTWRRYLHENPELSNREFKTAEMVANHLRGLNIEVKTGVAKTGVVGILRGGKPGATVALRADMDALPIVERVNIPFASKVKSVFNGQEVGVMHACGHDAHVAMLMSAATILASMRQELAGTVVFLFQPAEEGAPEGETGGASLMVKEGALDNPKVEAVFGIHINAQTEVGKIKYKSGGMMAAADVLKIKVKGRGAHGARPWEGIDPIVVSAQIINGLQSIVSRQMNITNEPVVITIGQIKGGVRNNIISEEVEMWGTIRTLDPAMQPDVWMRIKRTAENIAESFGAVAEVSITPMTPINYNDPSLTEKTLPTLEQVAGKQNVSVMKAVTGAEDFAFYREKAPSFFMYLGGMPKGANPDTAPSHHTADFFIDDSGMKLGVRSFVYWVLDYLNKK